MARTATFLSLRSQALQRADMVNSEFISTTEIGEYVNQSYAELYEMLIQSGKDYALDSSTISIVNGTDTYDLPDDFYQLRGVDVDVGGSLPLNMVPFTFEERNMYPTDGTWSGAPVRYRLLGSQIKFIPMPTGAYSATLWYHPAPPRMVSDSDTVDGVAGWEEYVVLGAAIKCLVKEESDASALMAMQASQVTRILGLVGNRDAGRPERVTDVVAGEGLWWRG